MSVSLSRACKSAWAVAAAVGAAAAPAADEVVVSATRSPIRIVDAVAEVSVIDRATLDRSEARTLVELLSQTPGLQYASSGGLGKPAALFVRGLEARHVLLLVDGVRVGSATVNAASLDNLPLETIERIEIARGPMTSLYGSGAMGGVVQVFTRRGDAGTRANARLAVGSHAYGLASAGVGHAGDGIDVAVQLQGLRNEGYSATNPAAPFGVYNPDDDGLRQRGGSLRAGWAFAPRWRAEVLALESRGETQYDDGPGADARAALRSRVLSLQVEGQALDGWLTKLAGGQSVDGYDTLTAASPWAELGLIETDQRQLAWENRLRLPLGEALLVAERWVQRVAKPGQPYDIDRRTIDALAAGWTVRHGAHDLQASLRHDDNSQFGGQTTGALAYALALDPVWRLGAAYGTSFTAPSFNDLYYPGFGNPQLQPEEGEHGELFVQWRRDAHEWRATAYRHRYRSFIATGPRPTNIPRVAVDGLTLAWQASLEPLTASASFDWVDPRNDTAGSVNDGNLLPRRAQRALKAGLDWADGPWAFGATLQAYSERYDDVANTLRLGGYSVVDLHADRALAPQWLLGLRLNNVFDKAYETVYGYNQPRREVYLTLRWQPR